MLAIQSNSRSNQRYDLENWPCDLNLASFLFLIGSVNFKPFLQITTTCAYNACSIAIHFILLFTSSGKNRASFALSFLFFIKSSGDMSVSFLKYGFITSWIVLHCLVYTFFIFSIMLIFSMQVPLFNQLVWLLLSNQYLIYSLEQIIHNIPTWWNISFNTNLVIISSIVEFLKFKPVSLLQLIHLIAIISTTSPYFSSLSPNKNNWNMANTFKNEGIIPFIPLEYLQYAL